MMTQSEVYRLFGEIDRLPGIMEPRLGRWHAWPIAKMQLVWHLMQAHEPGSFNGSASLIGKLKQRVPRYGKDLVTAVRQRSRINATPGTGTVGMIYLPRVHQLRDGRVQDFIFGDLISGEGLLKPSLPLEQPWPAGGPIHRTNSDAVDLSPYQSVAEQLAVALMASPRIRRTAAGIEGELAGSEMPLDPAVRERKILLALSLFEAKRRLFRRLAKRAHLQALVVTYGPGRFAEIAAAHELGLPVIELQHGVIGPHCPDYAWPADYRSLKPDMPVPDRIAVFGRVFRDLILRSGFWRESEISSIGSAAMEAFRHGVPPRRRDARPLRLVFMTQATSRPAAVAFWQEVARSDAFKVNGLHVALKIHPEEHAHTYQPVVNTAPDRFRLLVSSVSPIEAMMDADVVVSYNSMALVEALGLGMPAVSLCGGIIPGGFAGSFDLGNIVSVMPHVASPQELLAVLNDRAGNEQKLTRWRDDAATHGRDFFTDGFTVAAKNLINETLTQSARSQSIH
ncbi:MAG: hypothetical protein K2Z80_28970 [Xanthobacteraceae bacterium]|nr:hypothetical protein [Xanthobacteraceae bacterium]